MALIGNLRNFFSTVQSMAIAGLYNGMVKLIGKFKNNVVELTNTLSTVFYLGFFTSVFLAFICYYNAEFINELIFLNNNYTYVIEDTGYYCSELVYEAFADAELFQLEPMTFKTSNNTAFHPTWLAYYSDLDHFIPEGYPGCNPNQMAAHKSLYFLKSYEP